MILVEPQDDGDDGISPAQRRVLLRYLSRIQHAVGLQGEVTVLLAGDKRVRSLNRTFRKKNKATDVLSFPADPVSGVAGDLAISLETAARQAGEYGHTLLTELRILILHGVLHLEGMDHETDTGEMVARETALRARFRLPAGLIERMQAGNRRSRSRMEKAQ